MPQQNPTTPKIGYVQALALTADWTGQVCRETWSGKHFPWRRITWFLLLSSWASTISLIFQLFYDEQTLFNGVSVPFLQILSKPELEEMKDSHRICMESLCEEVGRGVPVHCIVNDDGTSARVEYDEDEPTLIPIPETCHEAIEKTFGYRWLDKVEGTQTPAVSLLKILSNSNDNNSTSNKQNPLLKLLPDCSIEMDTSPYFSQDEMEAIKERINVDDETMWGVMSVFDQRDDVSYATASLVDLFGGHVPGHRETYVLKNLFCPDELPEHIQTNFLPGMAMAYDFLLEYRLEIMAVGMYCCHVWMAIFSVLWLMVRLLLPSLAMKRGLTWPDSVTYLDIWRTLILLCLVSDQNSICLLLSVVLAAGACYYRNAGAAMEWVFLGMISWGASDLFSYMDAAVGNTLERFDGLSLCRRSIHVLVVGEGWWKLVTLYVVTRAYQSLREPTRPRGDSDALRATELFVENHEQQHFKED